MSMSNHGWWLLVAALASTRVAASETSSSRSIYRCDSGDTVTFSDLPCATGAEVYAPEVPVNTYEPPKPAPRVGTAAVVRSRTRREPDREAAAQAKLAERCQRIQQSLRDIRSKMRAGYTAKEGERLRERQNRLAEQRRAAKCR